MDWIEQLFGVSPDGGHGELEVMIVASVVCVVAAILLWKVIRLSKHKSVYFH